MLVSDRKRAFGIWFLVAVAVYLALYLSNIHTVLLDMEADPLLFFEYSRSLGFTPVMLPIISAIPFGAGFCVDVRNSFLTPTLSRCGRSRYIRSKFLFCCFSGAAAAFSGTLLFFLYLLVRFPADVSRISPYLATVYVRDVLTGGGIGRVALFIAGILLIQALAGSFWAACAMTFSAFCPNAALSLCAPMVVYRLVSEVGGAVAFPSFLSPAVMSEAAAGLGFRDTLIAGTAVFTCYTLALYLVFRCVMYRRFRRA